MDGLAILSALNRHEKGFHAQIEGFAASMAAVISMQADHVSIPADGWLMFHRIRGGGGTAPELVEQAARMEEMESNLISFLAARLDQSEEEVTAQLDAEIWLTGEAAGAAGLVHEVTSAQVMAALLEHEKYEHAPDAAKQYLSSCQTDCLDGKTDLDKKQSENSKKNETVILVLPNR